MTQLLIGRWLVYFGSAVLVLGGVTGWAAWTYRPARAARDMTRPRRKPEDPEKIAEKARALEARGLDVLPLEIPSAHTRPDEYDVTLRGWFIRSHTGIDKCAILYHGLGPCRVVLEDWMDMALEAGWNVAAFDLRAHGISDGEYCTYGFLESLETADEIRYIRERFHQNTVALFGYSMGGAVSVLSLGHLDPGEVAGVLTVGAYSDFVDEAQEYLASRTYGWSTERWRDQVIAEGERIFGTEAKGISPEKVASRLDWAPRALIIHGKEDKLVSFSHAARLAGAFDGRARLFPVDEADHVNVLEKGGEPLRAAVREFLHSLSNSA